jgi:hypothetical protein
MSIADREEARQKRGIVAYTPKVEQPKDNSTFDFSKPASAWFTPENIKTLFAAMPSPTPLSYGGGGMSASDRLAQQKFDYEKQKDAAEKAQSARTLAAYQNMLSGGGYRSGIDDLLGVIEAQGKTTRGNVQKAYEDALAEIGAGYDTAQGLTTKGYGALEEFLRANPNNPYANVQVSAGTAPDAMEQLLSAYGVSAEPVRAQVAAEQAAAQQGAAGFQNLLSTLGGVAQQSDLSRLAEMEMARTLAGETLGTQRATYSSQAARGRADALAQIEAQLAQARLEQLMAANARRQQIEDVIVAAGGSVPSSGSTGGSGSGSGKGSGTDTAVNLPEVFTPQQAEDERRRRELAALALLGNQYLAQPTLGMFGME